MNDNYNNIPRNPVGCALLSLFCGVVGTVIVFSYSSLSMISAAMGAVGMIAGGFAVSLASHHPSDDRVRFMLLAGVGIIASVVAFMFGFVKWLG